MADNSISFATVFRSRATCSHSLFGALCFTGTKKFMSMPSGNTRTIFKIVSRDQWEAACSQGSYLGSQDDMRDGFIHFSTAQQLRGTLAKHFQGKNNLVLVAFSSSSFTRDLKWEPSRGGALFPHLYAPIPTDQALWTKPLILGEDGIPELPQGIEEC